MPPPSKRRKVSEKIERIEELTFDPTARQEYLTGFHKRKQARIESARQAAVKREREEKVKERKQLREQRKEDLEQHVAAVNEELKKQNAALDGDSTEAEDGKEHLWDRVTSHDVEPELQGETLPDDEEYVDEDKYTTVTVEPMGEAGDDNDEGEEKEDGLANVGRKSTATTELHDNHKAKRSWRKDGSAKAGGKKTKFRYESKGERALTRQKQKSKNRVAKARRMGK